MSVDRVLPSTVRSFGTPGYDERCGSKVGWGSVVTDVRGQGQGVSYDRRLLLFGAKRNVVLKLWEVRRYGADSFGDEDHVCLYGMRPVQWYAHGVRVLGRTAVECTGDRLADAIGADIAAIARTAPRPALDAVMIVDPFAGSGNTVFWMLRHLPAARALGFELDPIVYRLTGRNLALLGSPIELRNVGYRTGLAEVALSAEQLLVSFVAPPWGQALGGPGGLDLRRTTPPIPDVVDALAHHAGRGPMLCAVQVHESVDPVSLAELTPRFDWSELRIYRLGAAGGDHGVLLGTRGWVPWPPTSQPLPPPADDDLRDQ